MENLVFMALSAAFFALAAIAVYKFIQKPSAQQIDHVLEWLKIAVVNAEKEFGGGTGQLKLRAVYESAIIKFPWLSTYVSFDTFSTWVDLALVWMNSQLENNVNIKNYIQGDK